MGVKVYFLYTEDNLEPGASRHFNWDCPSNALGNRPGIKAYAVDARPFLEFRGEGDEAKIAKLEITRSVRKVHLSPWVLKGKTAWWEFESISGYVKNVGDYTIGFDMYLIAFDAS